MSVYYQRLCFRPPKREFASDGSLQAMGVCKGETVHCQRLGFRPPQREFASDGSLQTMIVCKGRPCIISGSCECAQAGTEPRLKGLRDRNSPTYTLSQNGYGDTFVAFEWVVATITSPTQGNPASKSSKLRNSKIPKFQISKLSIFPKFQSYKVPTVLNMLELQLEQIW